MILPATDTEGARRVAEMLRSRVQELAIPNRGSDLAGLVTVSCGVASLQPVEGLLTDTQLTPPDRALYEAKRAGRNRVAVAD